MRMIGYARVSTHEQNLDLQIDALEKSGCTRVYKDDGVSAVAKVRPEFDQAINVLEAGDTLMIWKLDRAFRSVKQAVLMLDMFEERQILFRCLTEPIDTTNAFGRSMYQFRSILCELERGLISERTIAGMEAARRRGAKLGRPRKLSNAQVSRIQNIIKHKPTIKLDELAANFGVSPRTLNRALSRS